MLQDLNRGRHADPLCPQACPTVPCYFFYEFDVQDVSSLLHSISARPERARPATGQTRHVHGPCTRKAGIRPTCTSHLDAGFAHLTHPVVELLLISTVGLDLACDDTTGLALSNSGPHAKDCKGTSEAWIAADDDEVEALAQLEERSMLFMRVVNPCWTTTQSQAELQL